jgi:hypothetical protein
MIVSGSSGMFKSGAKPPLSPKFFAEGRERAMPRGNPQFLSFEIWEYQ